MTANRVATSGSRSNSRNRGTCPLAFSPIAPITAIAGSFVFSCPLCKSLIQSWSGLPWRTAGNGSSTCPSEGAGQNRPRKAKIIPCMGETISKKMLLGSLRHQGFGVWARFASASRTARATSSSGTSSRERKSGRSSLAFGPRTRKVRMKAKR